MITREQYKEMKMQIEEFEEAEEDEQIKKEKLKVENFSKFINELNQLGYSFKTEYIPTYDGKVVKFLSGYDKEKDVYIKIFCGFDYEMAICSYTTAKGRDENLSFLCTIDQIDNAINFLVKCKAITLKHRQILLPLMKKYNIKEAKEIE